MAEKTVEEVFAEIREIVAAPSIAEIPAVLRRLIQAAGNPPGVVTIVFNRESGSIQSASMGNVSDDAAGFSLVSSACLQAAQRFQQESLRKQREPQE